MNRRRREERLSWLRGMRNSYEKQGSYAFALDVIHLVDNKRGLGGLLSYLGYEGSLMEKLVTYHKE